MGRAAAGIVRLAPALLALLTCAAQNPPNGSLVCAGCHADIWRAWRRTGMAHSLYRPGPENTVEDYTHGNSFHHAASDIWFAMIQRDGRYFQRQWQIGFDGRETNVVEKEIEYVMGSGNHARTYLHRQPDNTLVELPLSWYAENGGTWAMSPGYDRPDHQGFRRQITYDCMFCHNAYPGIPAGAPRSPPVFLNVPEGIDCQRCHGDGAKHAELAGGGHAPVSEIRAAIVNPARLAPERQMEVCMQCHLETTSSPLPASIVRYQRGPFSYRPGEPLSDFMLHFDYAPGTGHDDRFEITGSAYRLRKSACFRRSGGALTCTTCHDPHPVLEGTEAAEHFAEVCQSCHAAGVARLISGGRHTTAANCVSCHMPKRRTEDVVHAVMTDHWIQRPVAGRDLLAPFTERRQTGATAYRGKVVLYYPASLPKPADALYLAIAQVNQSANLNEGIAELSAAVAKYRPAHPEYYLQLADALANARRFEEAVAVYEEAIRRAPESAAAYVRLGLCLTSLRQYSRAEGVLRKAAGLAPKDAATPIELGMVYLGEGRTPDAIDAFEKATRIDPEMAEAWNSLGAIRFEKGDVADAEASLRNAVLFQPNYAAAHDNLGNLLSSENRFAEAEYQFRAALRYKDDYAGARYNYALALSREHRLPEAQAQVEELLRIDPRSAEAHQFLGTLLSAQGKQAQAIEHFRKAVQLAPEFSQANLDLGAALVRSGDVAAALPYLRKAVQTGDAATRQQAQKLLRKVER